MSHLQPDHNVTHNNITPARLEAFSDGVLAIIITITVLELKVPEGESFHALTPLLPLFIAYLVSFQTVGTYWNNHHHLLRITDHVTAGIMWANLHLLFWLSLIPFGTGWLGENHGGSAPTILYSAILVMCAVAYFILQSQVLKNSPKRAQFIEEFNRSPKGIISICVYALAVVAGFYNPIISDICIVLVSLVWLIPDRRIEKYL